MSWCCLSSMRLPSRSPNNISPAIGKFYQEINWLYATGLPLSWTIPVQLPDATKLSLRVVPLFPQHCLGPEHSNQRGILQRTEALRGSLYIQYISLLRYSKIQQKPAPGAF